MTTSDWISVGNLTAIPAAIAAARLKRHGIPCKVMDSGIREDLEQHLWVPPDRAAEAKSILSTDEVPEDELTNEAMSFPPPDDA